MAACLDGGTNVMSYYGARSTFRRPLTAVEEFKVQSGTMSAEFGFTAGGVINLVTRSARINSTARSNAIPAPMTSWTRATPSPR